MGVAGSGKTSVGEALAKRLGVPFRDADEFHPKANIDKMSAGIPLTDDDRWPWLDAIGKALADADGRLIVACSALRRAYRDRLTRAAGRPVIFVWLDGSKETIAARMKRRKHHFMPPSLLDSQFATLEAARPRRTGRARLGRAAARAGRRGRARRPAGRARARRHAFRPVNFWATFRWRNGHHRRASDSPAGHA